MIKKFPATISVIIIFFIVSDFLLYLLNIFNLSQFMSVLFGLVITTFNFLAGIISAKISLGKHEKIFIKIVFGSMVIRLFLMLIIILITLLFLDINRNSFIFSIFFFYIFYLLIEVFYLNYRKN